VEADLFFIKATEILAKQTVSTLLVSRLSTLLNTIVMKQRSGYTDSIGFLIQLLRFIDEPSVFSMFSSICSVSPKLTALQSVIAASNFAPLILSEFNGELSTEKLANLCAIVRVCLKNPILEREFATDSSLQKLLSLLNRDDILLQNQLWQALSALCTPVTFSKMADVQVRAIQILETSFLSLHMYHVCAFDFLGKYIYFAPNGFSEADATAIFNLVLRAAIAFPDATNLITSMFRFLRTAMHSIRFQADILTALVPIFTLLADSRHRTAIVAGSRQFLADLEVYRRTDRDVDRFLLADPDYCRFRNSHLRKYIEDCRVPYGGPISRKPLVCRDTRG
jgi:hypothetical protein